MMKLAVPAPEKTLLNHSLLSLAIVCQVQGQEGGLWNDLYSYILTIELDQMR